jgi:3-carboxy-cis,cis-muconate cycloisomerase
MAQEHERAAGAWQSEWAPLGEALALTAGAAAWLGEALAGLEPRPDRMRANLELTGGLLMAESVTTALADRVGQADAREAVEAAARRAADADRPLRDELLAEASVSDALTEDELDAALDPERYLGCAGAFVDRALARYAKDGA